MYREEFFVQRDTRVRQLAGGAGAPLFYLHGAGGGGEWLPFLADLARDFAVTAPEHPGFGASDDPPWLDKIEDLALFYLDRLKARGGRVHLVGASLGGWLAAEMAMRDTRNIASLTLIGAAGVSHPEAAPGDIFLWPADELVRNSVFDPALVPARLARMEQVGIDTILKNRATTAKLSWNPRFHNPQLQKWLARIDVPCLIAWGREDKIMPVAFAEVFRAGIPGARVVVYERCGHSPHLERREDFVRDFRAFAKDIAA